MFSSLFPYLGPDAISELPDNSKSLQTQWEALLLQGPWEICNATNSILRGSAGCSNEGPFMSPVASRASAPEVTLIACNRAFIGGDALPHCWSHHNHLKVNSMANYMSYDSSTALAATKSPGWARKVPVSEGTYYLSCLGKRSDCGQLPPSPSC